MRSILLLLLLALTATAAEAQRGDGSFISGIKLKGNLHFNRTSINSVDDVFEAENAYGAGLEYVGSRFGLGLYGYTDGRTSSFDADTTTFYLVGEANYYFPIEGLRLAPYAGVHTHLGNFDRTYFDDPFLPRPQDGFDSLGYQLGVRYKPFPFIAVDAQWRRQSDSVWEAQDGFLERNQVLVGVVLF
jgi:hypothetical protein